MKTREEIKTGLEYCSQNVPYPCNGCPYERDELLENAWRCNLNVDVLAYIKQLEAFAPPVTIGTPIFSVCYNEDRDGFFVKESTVAEIWCNCNGWFFLEERHVGPAFKKRDIGKLIYLNREEAEFICEEFTAKLPDPPKEG